MSVKVATSGMISSKTTGSNYSKFRQNNLHLILNSHSDLRVRAIFRKEIICPNKSQKKNFELF